MSQSVARYASTMRNFRFEFRRHRRSDADKISLPFDAHASTRRQKAITRWQEREPSSAAALYQRHYPRKGALQIAPPVLETGAPCFAGGHRPPLQPNTLAARK